MPRLDRAGLEVELFQKINEVVVVVVGLDLVERTSELTLAVLQLLKHRFDRAASFGDFADLLAQSLLTVASLRPRCKASPASDSESCLWIEENASSGSLVARCETAASKSFCAAPAAAKVHFTFA